MVVYQLLCGALPFGLGDPSEDFEETGDRIVFEPLAFPPSVSDGARSFCASLLQKDPARRANAAEAMEHEWLRATSELRPGTAEIEARGGGGAEAERRSSILSSLAAFSRANAVTRHAYHALAFSASSADVKALRKAFVEMDRDGSGTVSLDEWKAVMGGAALADGLDTDALFAAMDARGSGEVEWRWFLAAALHGASGPSRGGVARDSPSLVDTFLLLDRDGDGYVDAHDLAALFAQSSDGAVSGASEEEVRTLQR